jgi:hypothetical protein
MRPDVIEQILPQISPTTSYPSLCDSVLPGTFKRSSYRADPHRPNCCWDFRPILGIAIEDQELARRIIWERFSQLLNDPIACRVLSNIEVQYAPTIMADDEKTVKNAESQRRNREEIHGGDRFSVIAENASQRLAGSEFGCPGASSGISFARKSQSRA